jgi:hypothetical protein
MKCCECNTDVIYLDNHEGVSTTYSCLCGRLEMEDTVHGEIEKLEMRLATHLGCCKILSLGDKCDCTLCKQDKIIAKLRIEVDRLKGLIARAAVEED